MKNKKKIFFIVPSLKAGGAERIFSFVSQQIDKELFDVTLVVLGFKKDDVYIVKDIHVKYLNKSRLLLAIPSLYIFLLKQKPHIVIGSIGHVNIALGFFSLFFYKTKFIGREASVITTMNLYSPTSTRFYSILQHIFYTKLDKVICQSQDMKEDFKNNFHIPASKLIVINNPITEIRELTKAPKTTQEVRFITIGRLGPEKGYLRLLHCLSLITSYKFNYTVIGSGPQEQEIKDTVANLNLMHLVRFIPYTSNVLEELNNHDWFLQGSYVEGFPNGLLESCTVGTPVLAFNAPGGTKEIIVNGINGFMVDNETEMSDLLNDLDKLKSICHEDVKKSVCYKFEADKIINQYQDLFLKN
jgi:glycosyltransferase involved in cell wall biosynthesis